jgi:hypothetical protein
MKKITQAQYIEWKAHPVTIYQENLKALHKQSLTEEMVMHYQNNLTDAPATRFASILLAYETIIGTIDAQIEAESEREDKNDD